MPSGAQNHIALRNSRLNINSQSLGAALLLGENQTRKYQNQTNVYKIYHEFNQ